MAKREIPLFILDNNRAHNLGECDFITCTDIDNGFVGKIDYTHCQEEISDTVRTGEERNVIRVRMEIKRIIGKNPTSAAQRSLLKKAMEYYTEINTVEVNTSSPTDEQCIDFLDTLIKGNRHNLTEAGVDYNERKIIATSLNMLEVIKDKLKNIGQNE